ncbi:MAG: hypothetical protein IJ410_08155 [Oscillospiraceae bacterium]|nr:hypothetical protein [Oscillospiraceae bacterium]
MNSQNLQLTATNIRYLITIHHLGQKDRFVKCADVSKILSVTRPSVHAMMKTLTEMALIEKPRYGKVNFTARGMELAEEYVKAYRITHKYFSPLFPKDSQIDEVVCAFISQIPFEMLGEVCDNMGKTV